MNWFFRLFIHFEQIEGSRQKAVENLQKVVQGGRYYGPFARHLLAVLCYHRIAKQYMPLPEFSDRTYFDIRFA